MFGSVSLRAKLDMSNGRPSGFDWMRVSLSVAVVLVHSIITSYGMSADEAIFRSPLSGPARLVLPMFFGLSGFLVAGSLLRTNTLVEFLGLRFIRIYPALAVEVFLSALLLGPLVSTTPVATYFTSSEFLRYILNVTGHISYKLPGVFAENPIPYNVNQQLWTVPYELMCYVAIAGIGLIGLKKRPLIGILATVGLYLAFIIYKYIRVSQLYDGHFPEIKTPTAGIIWVECFLFGAIYFIFANKLPWSGPLTVVAGVVSVVVLGLVPVGEYFIAPVAAYFTVCLGVTNPRRISATRTADYSYGVYLYSFVIQQAMVYLFPVTRNWWLNFLIAIPLSFLFAAFSWHYVEKPALNLKGRLPKRLPSIRLGATALRAKSEHIESK